MSRRVAILAMAASLLLDSQSDSRKHPIPTLFLHMQDLSTRKDMARPVSIHPLIFRFSGSGNPYHT